MRQSVTARSRAALALFLFQISEFEMFRLVPLVVLVLAVVSGIWFRNWAHRRSHGSHGIVDLKEKRLTSLGLWQALLAGGMFLQALLFWLAPGWLAFMSLQGTVGAGQVLCGSALWCASTLALVIAQQQMGSSWRMGIDSDSHPGLVTTGFFNCSRNPIYFSAMLMLLGYAISIPTGFSALLLVGCVVGYRRQALNEEAHLLRIYGDEYRAYAARVGRFVPGIGRLK